jgi:hypothetical protein
VSGAPAVEIEETGILPVMRQFTFGYKEATSSKGPEPASAGNASGPLTGVPLVLLWAAAA